MFKVEEEENSYLDKDFNKIILNFVKIETIIAQPNSEIKSIKLNKKEYLAWIE